jgi:cytochrome c2
LLLASCDQATIGNSDTAARHETQTVIRGDAGRGRALVASGLHGCAACHSITGLKNARGIVGPRLDGFAGRSFIGGVVPNQPGQLVAFLQNPPAIAPGTAMPMLGLTDAEARDIAAYLYTLKETDR